MPYNEQTCVPDSDKEILTLSITQQCNLACTYCYQVDRRINKRHVMPIETAKNAIREHLTKKNSFNSTFIELIGGEVFLYWKWVQEVISWTIDNRELWVKPFTFFIDTNGTLLNDEIKNWLSERRSYIIVGLSLDGTPEAHNVNRSGSYNLVEPHIPFFAKNWPNQTVKMTLSPNTLHLIFDGHIHCLKFGLNVAANLPLENIWGKPEEKKKHVITFKKEIEKLVDFYGEHADLILPSLLDIPIYGLFIEKRNKPWCGAGRNMSCVEDNGSKLPCNRFSVMSFDQTLFGKQLSPEKGKCHYCMFRNACQTCEAHNWEINGNPNERTTFHCEFTKLQIWGAAQLHLIRFEKRLKYIFSMTKEEQKKYKEEARQIQESLFTIYQILAEFEKYEDPTSPAVGLHRELGKEDEWKNRSLDPKDRWNIIYPNVPYPGELVKTIKKVEH